MRQFIYIIICISLICSCDSETTSVALELSQENITCTTIGGEFEITINRPDWTTDNTADWISIRKNGSSALISISSNDGGFREHRIGFRIDGREQASILIQQDHSNEFHISKDNAHIGFKADTIRVSLTCYDNWTANTDSEWLSIDTTEGDSPAEICIFAELNTLNEARMGTVRFSSGEKTIEMIIQQSLPPLIEVEKEIVEFDGDGGQTFVLFMSNTEVVISCEHDWIRLIETDEAVRKVSFEVKRNLADSREGKIKIASSEYRDVYKTITVRQGPKIDHPALSFEEGTHMERSSKEPFFLHPVFVDMSNTLLTWNSDNKEVATVDMNGNVIVHSGGECIITAKNSYHGVQASIKLSIKPKAEGMKIMFDDQDMDENPIAVRFAGEKITINTIMNPSDAYTGDLTYFSTDESVASIDGNTILCRKNGKAEIYIESIYQSLRKSYTVIILDQ